MDIREILNQIVKKDASDIFIVAGRPLAFKVNEQFVDYDGAMLTPQDTEELITQIYLLANGRRIEGFLLKGDDDFSFSLKGVSRFRVNMYKQRGSLASVIRVINFELPNPKELYIPETVLSQVDKEKGMVLVTGSAGCGKSTTLACMIDRINTSSNKHIVTLEDPIEYLHPHKKSIISQREITLDTENYLVALRSALRQSPNVIFIGELRDEQTINISMTSAETGHLLLSTLHTIGAANTIDRIIDMYPSDKQSQARLQLSMVLQSVISQQLVITKEGIVRPVFEIMVLNPAIRNMIRESKTHQIDSAILSGANEGMISMDASLLYLYKNGEIDEETAIMKSQNPELMKKRVKQ